jgi:hypothetical protein
VALDRHPIELNRDEYLKQTLALDLMRLDQLETAFADKALVALDVANGVLLVKAAERGATLLGLNASLGHAVRVIQHRPVNKRLQRIGSNQRSTHFLKKAEGMICPLRIDRRREERMVQHGYFSPSRCAHNGRVGWHRRRACP